MTPNLVNTSVRAKDKPSIDVVSKIFIIIELPLGIVRLPLIRNVNKALIILSIIYSFILGCYYSTASYRDSNLPLSGIIIVVSFIQCAFYMVFNLILVKRLQRYYNELKVFDIAVGCTPKIEKATILNLILFVGSVSYMASWIIFPAILYYGEELNHEVIAFLAAHIIELHYFGHLLSLVVPRMRLINYYMELSLTNHQMIDLSNVEKFGYLKSETNESLVGIDTLMELYHNMIRAYDYLTEAIKWQMTVTIIVTFIGLLTSFYTVALLITKNEVPLMVLLTNGGISVGVLIPVFAPCILADLVHSEVRRFRELLASRLYENKLDKSGRGMARALLAWTETRDLSFSLLRMLDIDISLPFKFVGVLVTYLIILLQFQIILNP